MVGVPVRLYSSLMIVVGSQGIPTGRAKIIMGAEVLVYSSREIAVGHKPVSMVVEQRSLRVP